MTILVITLGVTLYLSNYVRDIRLVDLESHLLAEAKLIASSIAEAMLAPDAPDLSVIEAQARQWGIISGERVTIIGADGTVLGESHADATTMGNQRLRPEIQAAIEEGEGVAIRFSRLQNAEVMYAAVPVARGEILGFVRIAFPLNRIEENVRRLSRTIIATGLVIALLAIALNTYIASRVVQPIRQLIHVVEQMAEGDLGARMLPLTQDEIGQLTRAFNHMADQLRDQVARLGRERARLSAVLNNMADGAIITDIHGTVTGINPAARQILHIDRDKEVIGSTFAQLVHHHQLIELWQGCYQSNSEQIATLETGPGGAFLQAIATPITHMETSRILVILQDLTKIRRLETVRRDFISNISHELRTPLASLSLVVETLQDGAIEQPVTAQRFLSHMENELHALTQMVEELLELSRIESGKVPLEIKPTPVKVLVQKPFERMRPQAQNKKLIFQMKIPSQDIPLVMADAQRIHQVITNLLHNAIKFTPPNGAVTLFAQIHKKEEHIIIGVTDTGVGIPADDLARIFERFYKTDQARADEGTGLGLSIAKHIVQGHRGQIWAESTEGIGSTFFFSLPFAP
jgi:two-component system phosphate regulon sensor histidine kinase PhoR